MCLFSSQIPFFNMCTLFFLLCTSDHHCINSPTTLSLGSSVLYLCLAETTYMYFTKSSYTLSVIPKQKRNCVYIVHRALLQAPTSSGGFPAWALVHPACGGPDRPVRIRIIVYLCVRIRICGMIIIQLCVVVTIGFLFIIIKDMIINLNMILETLIEIVSSIISKNHCKAPD